MADDNKPGTNLASGGVVVAALAALGIYYFHHEAPLVDLRPVNSSIYEQAAPQTIDARLWQDPLAAVEKSRNKSDQGEREKQCQENPRANNHCNPPSVEKGAETLVLVVTVSGAPYQEDAEERRRARYAVLAGLERAGFVPKDARHIDYFVWEQNVQSRSSTPIALNKSAVLSPLFSWLKPSLGYPPQSAALELSPVLPSPLLANEAGLDRDNIATIPSPQPTIIPYERFGKPPKVPNGKNQSVLVLWLKEEALKDRPLQKLSLLIQLMQGPHSGKASDIHTKIIGPHSSDTLRDMVSEKRDADVSEWAELKNVQFYAYAASAPDRLLLSKASDTVRTHFHDDFDLQRTVATDDALAYGIATELKRRHVDPSHKSTDHIAMISEWDTVYGQTLPQAVERQFYHTRPGWHAPSGSEANTPIYKFTYLRGLDGLLPSAEGKEDQKQDKATAQGEKQAGTTDFFKIETDTKSLDRPIGQSQFDYLRRISEHLHKIDDGLRKKQPDNRIKAIGILGSDVFDKLLVLRALQPEFPEALFFTTDFDEAFTIKSELPFTRNLIISSSFGPNLSDKLQGEIPFFRDTYQTSAFLATLSAIGDNWKIPDISPSQLAERLRFSRIFEIGRTGHVFSFTGKAAPPSMLLPSDGEEQKGCSKTLWSCNPGLLVADDGHPFLEGRSEGEDDFQPRAEDLFPTFEDSSRETLAFGLAAGAIVCLVSLFFPIVRKNAWVEVSLGVLGLGVGSLICVFWEQVAHYLTEYGDGEPIVILEGVSVWPTVLLRGFGIILSVYLIWRVMRTLRENFARIAKDMGIVSERKSRDKRSLWEKIMQVFDFSLGGDQAARSSYLDVESAWQAYVDQERFWPRCCRAAICTAIMYGIFMFVLNPMFGVPVVPVRGGLALNWYWWTVLGDAMLMQFLTFFVFDATLFCLLFVNKLRRTQTAWPSTTMGVYKDRLRLQTKLVHDWIDLDFVAKRTRCIGSLIYFPFVLIALLIVSRSTVFANYAPSLTILISQGISLSIVFGCAFMLWWSAKAARDTAKQNLADGLIRAKDAEGNVYFAEQLESLLDRVDQLREGAFGPLTQQPLVKALLFPLSGAGWLALIENGILPSL